MNKKNIIIIITIMLIILCAIIISIIFTLGNLTSNNDNNNFEAPMLYTENDVIRVTGKDLFFTLENILNESIQEADKVFIKDIYTQDIETDVNSQFYIYASIWKNNYKNNENSYIIINLNREKLLYDLNIEKTNITHNEFDAIIENIPIYEENNQIEIKYVESNGVVFFNVQDEDVVKRNMEYYKTLAIYSPKEAYEILEEGYRQKRFGSIEKYLQYMNDYRDILENRSIIKYAFENEENVNTYIAIDDYDNYYIMQGETLYDFKMQLDNYTIEDEEYIKKYKDLDDEKKAQVCATKIIKMINAKDYENLYRLIDENYKNNNFVTINDFKKYINEKYYNYNMIDSVSVESNVNYYICSIKIRSGNNLSALESTRKIIVQLGEDTNFKISFVK